MHVQTLSSTTYITESVMYIKVVGKVMDSTLQTYITHFRYAIQFFDENRRSRQ